MSFSRTGFTATSHNTSSVPLYLSFPNCPASSLLYYVPVLHFALESYLISLVILFQQSRCHFLHGFLNSYYFSCQTNLYFVSSLAHGCKCPHTRLQSHSPQQTSWSFVYLRNPVSPFISPIFCFRAFDPISLSPQSYCCFYLFVNTILFLPLLPCVSLHTVWGKSLREGQRHIIQTTGWAGSLPVVVMVGLVLLLGHAHRYDNV